MTFEQFREWLNRPCDHQNDTVCAKILVGMWLEAAGRDQHFDFHCSDAQSSFVSSFCSTTDICTKYNCNGSCEGSIEE